MLTIPRGIIYHSLCYEIKSLLSSFFSNLANKEEVHNFENEFLKYMGTKHCIAFPFARTAIYYSLKTNSFPEGTEIIMPPISIKGILDVIIDLKLKPVFVDIDPVTLCFDLSELKNTITNKTKAILITYLYGIVPDMEDLMNVCKQNGLFVIEDYSHNLNATYRGKKLGTFGHVGIYSSSSVKTLDTFGGGLLITNNSDLYSLLRKYSDNLEIPPRKILIKKIITNLIRNFATNKIVFSFLTFPILRILKIFFPEDIIKYSGTREKTPIEDLPSECFYSYTSFQAKVGSQMLEEVSNLDKIRINNVERIKSAVNGIETPTGHNKGENIYWQLVFYFSDTEKGQNYFHTNKIDTSTTSLEYISSLKRYPYQRRAPNANKLYETGLFIPSYPGLKNRDIKHIINVLNNLLLNNPQETNQ